jgi:hypothetical protein
MLSLGYAVLAARLELPAPPPGTPGPFSMADPAQLVRELAAAGFVDVSVEEFVVPFRFASTQEYVDFNRAVTPPRLLGLIRERFGSVDDPTTWAAVGAAAEAYREDGGGLFMPSTALTVLARRC